MSTPESDPAATFAAPVSFMNRVRDSVAVQPPASPGPFRSVRTGWAAGRQQAIEDSAPGWPTTRPQVGPVNASMGYERAATTDPDGPPIDHTSSNEPASQESLDQLHQKVSDLQGSVASGSAGGNSGGGQSQQASQQQPQRTAPVSPLQQQAEAHQQALAVMLAGHQNLAQTRANTAAVQAQRTQNTAAATVVRPAGSAIGMSKNFSDQSFFGTQGSQNGVSSGTWTSARWSR